MFAMTWSESFCAELCIQRFARFRPQVSRIRMRFLLRGLCFVHMQVGPDNFALYSTKPQLFWKQ